MIFRHHITIHILNNFYNLKLNYCANLMDQSLVKHCQITLKKNNLNPIKKLGKGGFGMVFLVSKPSCEDQLYSVKCTSKKQFVKKPLLRRYLKQEIALMEGLEHENIVKLIRTFEDDGWIFMVMQYCDLGNINAIQTEKKDGVFCFDQTVDIIIEIINGLSFMHSQGILHRDIKPENVLRKKQDKSRITKICDLGFAREAKDDVTTFCGTTYYMAPQIFEKKQYDKKVDIWALGVLMFSMLFGNVPFKGVNMEMQIKSKCQNGFDLMKKKIKTNPSINKQKMKMLSSIFAGVFHLNPEKRWSLEMISETLGNKKFPQQNYDIPKKIHKIKTMDTDGSEEETPKALSFEMDQVWFVQLVLDEVSQKEFLDPIQFLALKYYLDKVCLSILSFEKELKKLNLKQKTMIERFWESQKRDSNILSQNIKDCSVPKLRQNYTGKSTINFQEYKEEYRLVVGHAFYKAHKCIKDYNEKMQMKLKIFCCHVINRVFEKDYRKELFAHYYRWLNKKKRSQVFDLRLLNQWINEDEVQNVIDTVETINNKFYRKSK